jgi:predicted RNA-binding Zn ribbon-like protein
VSLKQVPVVHVDEWQPSWFIGGHVVLDFVNTVPWRLAPERTFDRLPDAAALIGWAHAVELIDARQARELRSETAAHPARAQALATRTWELRENLYLVLRPLAAGEAPDETLIEYVRHEIVDALTQARIASVVPLHWTLQITGVRDLQRALALSSWRLLQFEDLTRVRQCRDSGCGWLFLDRSKNSSRRWCSSADCGNRTRARRHYRRRLQAEG